MVAAVRGWLGLGVGLGLGLGLGSGLGLGEQRTGIEEVIVQRDLGREEDLTRRRGRW